MKKRKVFLMNCLILLCIHVQSLLCASPNSDPVVGLGLLAPIVRTVNHVITAPFRNQARFAKNKARMRHRHLLHAENPLEDDGPVMMVQPNTNEKSTKTNGRNADLRSPGGGKLKNNKRDEEYYLWSLNNWVPYGRTKERSADFIAIDNIYAYNKALAEDPTPVVDVQLFANPNFYREYQVLPSNTKMRNIIPEFNGMDRFEGAPFVGINPKIFVMDNCGTDQANQLSSNHQGDHFVDPQNNFQSRFADPSDPRHFKIHHHSSSSFKKWFSADKPTPLDEPLMGWEYYKPPQIVINNHNQPLNINKQNSQVAQTSGDNNISKQIQAVFKNPTPNWNIQVADTSGHSSTSQSQTAVLHTDPRKEFRKVVDHNFQGAQTTHVGTALQSQAIANEGASSLTVPQPLFALYELNTNTQAAKTFDGSTSNQVQTIEGGLGPNQQFALTSGGSQSTQTQTAVPTNAHNAQLLRLPSPYLVDVPRRGKSILQRYKRSRRSLPLVRLMTDPNAKLDMPKTLENFGTVARNSFHDKRHPMYHMKNMVGSARDVFLSALRVPPQGIVIPSQYKIIDVKKEKAVPLNDDYTFLESTVEKLRGFTDDAKQFMEPVVGGTGFQSVQKTPQSVKERIHERINNLRANLGPKVKSRSIFSDGTVRSFNTRGNNDVQFTDTFQKMGNIFRESVKSGQQTLNHITDAAHSARKALTTSTLGAPRVVRPLMHAPVFETRRKTIGKLRDDPEKVTFVAPRFLDVMNDGSRPKDTADGFVDVGDIMDAFGVSDPAGDKVGLRRYVVHSKSAAQDGPVVGNRFKETNDIVKEGLPKKTYFVVAEDIEDNELVANEIDVIDDLTDLLGGNSLQDLLSGIKDKVLANKYTELEDLQVKLQTLQQEEERLGDQISSDEDIDQFIRSLFASPTPVSEEQRLKRQINQQQNTQHQHQHHHNLALPANLLRPFMGSPSRIELNDYFRHYNDFEEVTEDDRPESLTSEEMLQSQQDQFVEALLNPSEYISAINPKMYLKLFNEPLVYQHKYPKLDGRKVKDMVENHNIDVVGGSKREDEEANRNERLNMKVKDKLLRPHMGIKDNGFYESHVDYVPDFGYLPGYYVGHHQNNGYHY